MKHIGRLAITTKPQTMNSPPPTPSSPNRKSKARFSRSSVSVSSTSHTNTTDSAAAAKKRASVISGVSKETTRTGQAVWAGRALFVLFLTVLAAVLGFLGHHILSRSERLLATSQFYSIAERAVYSAQKITAQKRLGTQTMALVSSHANPYLEQYPFVTIPGFEQISTKIIQTSSGRSMGFFPLVKPHQLKQFEEFAYDFFYNTREPQVFPNTTAVSDFGRGVWGVDPKSNATDNRFRVVDGSTYYNSSYDIIVPMLHHSAGPDIVLMLNLHFEQRRGKAFDSMMDCVASGQTDCGALTDVLFLADLGPDSAPAAVIIEPMFAAKNQSVVSDFLFSKYVIIYILLVFFPSGILMYVYHFFTGRRGRCFINCLARSAHERLQR